MKRTICIIVMTLAACLSAKSQNINAQVQVTNDYQAASGAVSKLEIPVTVPDSVTSFDYNFDYSVFESPYRGAYEFTPYAIRVVPEPCAYDGHNLYVKAGAGYSLYPVLQAVYSTTPKGNFALSVYQDFQGYYGDYWTVSKNDMKPIAGSLYKGYDFSEKFGVEGSLRSDALNFSWLADYRGLYNSDSQLPTVYHSGGISANISASRNRNSYFLYDITLSARYGLDMLNHYFEPIYTTQHTYGLDATFGPVLKGRYKILVDVDARHDSYSGISAGRNSFVQLFPYADFMVWKFHLKAGAKLSAAGGVRSFRVHPDAEIDISLLNGGFLDIYAGITGGQHMHSYSEFKESYHRFNISYTDKVNAVTNDKFDVFAGVRGHIGSYFQYDVKAGYAMYENVPLAAVVTEPVFAPAIAFKDFNLVYADVDLSWKSESFEFTGGLNYRETSLSLLTDCFNLPLFSGDVSAVYNYRKRVFVGVNCEGATSRGQISAYADLGALAEYRFNSCLSLWAKGGNLLNMAIQRVPGYIEKGINFTAGITVKL